MLALGLAACSPSTPTALPTAAGSATVSDTPSPVPAPTFRTPVAPSTATATAACDIFDTLLQVDALLAGETYEAHFLTIGGRMSISIWLVDRAIDPATTAAGLEAANREAVATGLSLSHRVVAQIPCARRVFEIVNPMIVDSRYQLWYRAFLPIRAFTDVRDPITTDRLIEAVTQAGSDAVVGRTALPRTLAAAPSPAAGSCTWPQARAKVAALFEPVRRNVTAYPIIDGGITAGPSAHFGDVNVESQWDVVSAAEAGDAVTLKRLGLLTDALSCMAPKIGQLELFVVDRAGRLVVYARVPGSLIKPGGNPPPRSAIYLRHYAIEAPG